MTWLLYDSSCEPSWFAVARDHVITHTHWLPPGIRSAQQFPGEMLLQLKKWGIDHHEIEAVAGGIGPGSYTGVRIATAFMQGYLMENTLPFYPFFSTQSWVPWEQKKSFSIVITGYSQGAVIHSAVYENDQLFFPQKPQKITWSQWGKYQGLAPFYSPHPEEIKKHLPLGDPFEVLPASLNLPQLLKMVSAQKPISLDRLQLFYPSDPV